VIHFSARRRRRPRRADSFPAAVPEILVPGGKKFLSPCVCAGSAKIGSGICPHAAQVFF